MSDTWVYVFFPFNIRPALALPLNSCHNMFMPVISHTYQPGFFRNAHVNTTWSSKFRFVPQVTYQRQRFELSDGDFVDIDWSYSPAASPNNPSDKCVVILHGLGGSSQGVYVRGLVRALNAQGWDTAAYNFRGASGEMNRLPVTYHSGRTDDLHEFSTSLVSQGRYRVLCLVGFSLGGNVTLKYFGETGENCPYNFGAGVSVPMDLAGSAGTLEKSSYYMKYLLGKLRPFMEEKHRQFPDRISLEGFSSIASFREYDDRYTSVLNGFKDAQEYWEKSSSLPSLPNIKRPVLVLNALDDPFLSPGCFPFQVADQSSKVHFCAPRYGGHVGFMEFPNRVYTETIVPDFFHEMMRL